MDEVKLIIGLGNPSTSSGQVPDKYKNTYHNVGHLFIEYLQQMNAFARRLILLKTGVFMNKSGEFVRGQIKKNKIKPGNLLIVHDDSDIELGQYKLSFGRSSAGHRGVQNIIDQLKTKDFWRLRIGIRSPREKTRAKADELVLRKITSAHKKKIEEVFKKLAESTFRAAIGGGRVGRVFLLHSSKTKSGEPSP